MARRTKAWLTLVALIVPALVPAPGRAGFLLGCRSCGGADCPPGSYSPCHYWFPILYRCHLEAHGPAAPMYAPNRCCGIGPSYQVMTFPCPPVDPSVFAQPVQRPNPPEQPADR
jgi:hypothetical protein